MTQRATGVGGVDEVGAGPRLRRRWHVVLLGVLLGLAGAAAFIATSEIRYTATTSVLVLATGPDASLNSSRPDVNMDTESELVRSAQVAEVTRDLLGTGVEASTLLEGLEVTVPLNSQVLSIAYSDRTATSAQAGAQAFARAYLEYRTQQAQSDVAAYRDALQADLTAAQQELRQATDQAAALPPSSPDRVYAEAQRGILGNRISSLSARLSALQAASPTPGQIITDARLPQSPSSPNARLAYATGLVAGLLLGVALAALADRLDHRLRHPSDVARLVGEPVLLEAFTRRGTSEPGDGRSSAAFDQLRNALAARGGLPRLLQVADHANGEVSGAVAMRVAEALVRATGSATLVIAHDRSPVPRSLRLEDRDGLSEVITGKVDLDAALVERTELPGMRILPPGRKPQSLEMLLQSTSARALLHSLRESDVHCVVETLGTGQSAAAQAIATTSDRVLLVAERGIADGRQIRASAAAARAMGADVAGVVLNTPGPSADVRSSRGAQHRAGSSGRGPGGSSGSTANPRPGSASGQPGSRDVRHAAPAAPVQPGTTVSSATPPA